MRDFCVSQIIAGFHTTKLDYLNDSRRKTVHEYCLLLLCSVMKLRTIFLCQMVPSSAINAFVGKKIGGRKISIRARN